MDLVESKIITDINTNLNKAMTRNQGLDMLVHVILSRPVSNEILQEYALLWLSKATLVLSSNRSSTQDLTTACKVIGTLVVICMEIPEVQKQISIQNVKQLVAILSERKAEERCGAMFYLIAVLLYHYPEPCERLQVNE